jgi:DNA-binding HxlR family transcriptional regulator
MLIVRDVMTGAHRFGDLHRGLPGISRGLLADRLRGLARDGVIERRLVDGHPEYWLTPLGEDLQTALMALGQWAKRNYAGEPRRDEHDPRMLMGWVQRHARTEALPPGRFLAQFDFRGARPPRTWLLIEDAKVWVCDDHPGIEPELIVATDIQTLHRVFAGLLSLTAALRGGSLQLEGSRAQVRAFHRWFGYSPFAQVRSALSA